MTIKPTKLGARIARRLRDECGIRLIYAPEQHAVVRDQQAVVLNRVGGEDDFTWWLADQLGHAHIISTSPSGQEIRHAITIGSPQPASALANRKRCPTLTIKREGFSTIGVFYYVPKEETVERVLSKHRLKEIEAVATRSGTPMVAEGWYVYETDGIDPDSQVFFAEAEREEDAELIADAFLAVKQLRRERDEAIAQAEKYRGDWAFIAQAADKHLALQEWVEQHPSRRVELHNNAVRLIDGTTQHVFNADVHGTTWLRHAASFCREALQPVAVERED